MSGETLAIIIVAILFAQFVLLLVASLVRSRRASRVFKEAAAGARPRPEPEPAKTPTGAKPVSRREFFRRSLLASIGLFSIEFGAASLAFIWPNLRGGFGAVVNTGLTPELIKSSIQTDHQPFYYGAGRFYIVEYSGEGDESVYSGLVDDGLMALYQKCVHLGCRVPFCQQSQWFECPCHGSKYNNAGEYKDGPAPRGMDRFRVSIQDGTVQVDTSEVIEGPPRGTNTTGQEPEGPFCINIGGE